MNFKDVVNSKPSTQNELKNRFINNLNKIIYKADTGILPLSQSLYTNYNNLSESRKREELRAIIKKSEKLEYLVSNVLNFAKLSSQHFTLDTKITNLSEKIQQIIQTHIDHPRIKGGTQPIIVKMEEGILANCNIYYLEQAINNILNNAITYGKSNLIEISLYKNPKQINFCVKDKGIGIKENEINDIFKMFYVGYGSDRNSSGIGLALCKKIIKLHEGNIWAGNNKDGGAFFKFTIPS